MTDREPHYSGVPPTALPVLPRNPVHVVLDNLRSAFNVGSIFRTADAGAVSHIHLCGMSAHPPHIKLAKTALGAFDYVPWTYYERTNDALDQIGSERIVRVAIEVTPTAVPLQEFAWPKPVAIVLGNEVTGINERALAHCDAVVKIPMHGHKNSMNVATAFGIVLYHILNDGKRWAIESSLASSAVHVLNLAQGQALKGRHRVALGFGTHIIRALKGLE